MHGATIKINSGSFGFISHFKYDHKMRTEEHSKEITGGYKIVSHNENVQFSHYSFSKLLGFWQ